ncbi:hypothetical protein NIES4075_68400 [Tolypothrix sp. NIES-4075]|nr:hypothetical protein [Tolypothrix sp. NIES-4075]GAX45819.1 hypothetical protein NIES4075_68400 [Tolypothrix sp. NIES-4075]
MSNVYFKGLLGAIAEIIESSKNIGKPTDIGYWIDASRAMKRT